MASSLQLFISPGACSLAPHILLREAGLTFTLVKLDVKQNGFPEEYKHINSKGKVPILLIDPSTILTEGVAIMTYISSLAPEKNLFGKTPLEIARAYEWLNYISGTLHGQAFGGLFRPGRFSDDESVHGGIRDKARKNVQDGFELIESKLESGFAVGDGFTAVDAYLLVFYRWGNSVGFNMEKNYPKYTSLVEGVVKREKVVETLAEEGIKALVD
ncbi:glutathione S-transferase [Dendryphion nanum]|uniref:Glutathione S-transferase n=1 Tax=Dendryphion nanum TaxID=256645 RepID=A0A9P9IB43_9PLEO|nr:glutathione S-transferase [Dendryphion nanum]